MAPSSSSHKPRCRTRLQLAARPTASAASAALVAGGTPASILTSILREEGAIGLFRGVGVRMAKRCGSAAITWCLYEEIVRLIEKG